MMALDFELSEEQKAIKDAVRSMLKKYEGRREELKEMILKEKKFPQELWDDLAEMGLTGCLVPEEYGGNNMGLLTLTLAFEEMAANGFSSGLLLLTAMDTACILRNGTEEQKKRFLPDIAAGKKKMCWALTEPNAGSNAFRIQTIARKNGDGSSYTINGQKVFITGADIADHILMAVRTTPYEELKEKKLPKTHGLSLFVVDANAKGLEKKPIPTRGIEGMRQFLLHFDNVVVPAENLIGQEDQGVLALFNSLNPERILAAATCIGLMEYCLRKSIEYARERKIFRDTPIGAYQAIAHPLAKVKVNQEALRYLTYKAAWAFDKGEFPGKVGEYANMAKYFGAEVALDAVDRAIQTHGGYGFSEEYGIIYMWEGVRLMRTAPISQEMILNFISEHTLGLPRSY